MYALKGRAFRPWHPHEYKGCDEEWCEWANGTSTRVHPRAWLVLQYNFCDICDMQRFKKGQEWKKKEIQLKFHQTQQYGDSNESPCWCAYLADGCIHTYSSRTRWFRKQFWWNTALKGRVSLHFHVWVFSGFSIFSTHWIKRCIWNIPKLRNLFPGT